MIFNIFLSMALISVISNLISHGFEKVKLKLYLLALIIPLSNISFFIGLFCLVILTQFKLSIPSYPLWACGGTSGGDAGVNDRLGYKKQSYPG